MTLLRRVTLKKQKSKSTGVKIKFRAAKTGDVNYKWIVSISIITLMIAALVSYIALVFMGLVNLVTACLILLGIVIVGICSDILGIAVAAADETPFHSMSASRVPASKESIWLIRQASIVSNFCNDVIGDICGIISGAAGSAIVIMIIRDFQLKSSRDTILSIILASLVASITVGGKAIGKEIALRKPNSIVYMLGKIMHKLKRVVKRR